jgi:hypothetical protein
MAIHCTDWVILAEYKGDVHAWSDIYFKELR